MFPKRRYRQSAQYERVLGTSLDFQVVAATPKAVEQAEAVALTEIDRLEAVFNAYNPASELSRWQAPSNCDVGVSPELAELLEASEYWRRKTQGVFNPAVEALTRLWAEAAARKQPVANDALAAVVEELKSPLWLVDRECNQARRLTGLPITLNSVAKGFIIDRVASSVAAVEDVHEVLVNIGGDLRHLGCKPINVAIADPFADAENAEPVTVVAICNQGLATSGNYRRGFRIGDKLLSHVLDPRTGRPVEHTVSASVLAPSAMEADILATVFSILTPMESLAFANTLPGVGVFLVADNGSRVSNGAWDRQICQVSAK